MCTSKRIVVGTVMMSFARTQKWRNKPQRVPSDETSPVSSEATAKGTMNEPAGYVHAEIGRTHELLIPPGEPRDGESQETGDGAEPADRRDGKGDERNLAEARRHVRH